MTEIEIYTAFCMVALFSVTLLMCIYATRMEKRASPSLSYHVNLFFYFLGLLIRNSAI